MRKPGPANASPIFGTSFAKRSPGRCCFQQELKGQYAPSLFFSLSLSRPDPQFIRVLGEAKTSLVPSVKLKEAPLAVILLLHSQSSQPILGPSSHFHPTRASWLLLDPATDASS